MKMVKYSSWVQGFVCNEIEVKPKGEEFAPIQVRQALNEGGVRHLAA